MNTRTGSAPQHGAQQRPPERHASFLAGAPAAADAALELPTPPVPPRAVFVVGMPRSGTTLLTRLLEGHPQLFALPHESQALRWVGMRDPAGAFLSGSAYNRFYPAGSAGRQRFEALLRAQLQDRNDLRSILHAIVGAQLRMQGPAAPAGGTHPGTALPGAASPPTRHAGGGPTAAEAWVEKTPRHARDVPTLIATFGPDTRVIAMVRDPRAALASRRKVFRRTSENHVRHFARRWATVDALVHEYAARFPQQFLAVTYEALVTDPEAVMRRLAAHAGIRWDPSLLVPTYAGSEWQGNSSFAPKVTGVTTASLALWRSELAPAEIAQCEDLLRPRMLAWNYAPTTPARRGPRLERTVVEAARVLHVWKYRRAWARAADRAGARSGTQAGAGAG